MSGWKDRSGQTQGLCSDVRALPSSVPQGGLSVTSCVCVGAQWICVRYTKQERLRAPDGHLDLADLEGADLHCGEQGYLRESEGSSTRSRWWKTRRTQEHRCRPPKGEEIEKKKKKIRASTNRGCLFLCTFSGPSALRRLSYWGDTQLVRGEQTPEPRST